MKKLSYLFTILLIFAVIPMQGHCESNYYEGKAIEMINFASPGGGNDVAARVVIKHLRNFIPGKPVIVHRNMPGGGGVIAPNYVYNIAKNDGLTCLFGSGKNAVGSLIRVKGAKFDYKKMTCVLAIPFGGVHIVNHNILKNPEDIVKTPGLIYGGSSLPSMTTTFSVLSYEILGYKPEKIILAYRDTVAARLALLKGETTSSSESSAGYSKKIKPLVKKGKFIGVWQSGVLSASGDVVREPAVRELLTMKELYRKIYGKDPSGPAWDAYKMIVGLVATVSKTILFPPGNEKYAAIVAKACEEMSKDPSFKADLAKLAPGNPVYVGKELSNIWKAGLEGAKDESVNWLRNWMHTKYNVEIEQ